MKRSVDRILTTHVGSLVRPLELVELSSRARKDPGARPEYESYLHAAVEDVVRKQASVGIDIVNDGEYGKANWSNYILDRISGFELRPDQRRPILWLGRDRERFPEVVARELPHLAEGTVTQACVGPVRHLDKDSMARTISDLKAAVASVSGASVSVEEAFLTVVAPASTAYDGVNEYYPTEREYVFAIADALRQEYEAVYRAGLIVQVDDAVLANMYDELVQTSPHRYREWAQLRVEALNHALGGIPEDRVRYHVCFGSWHVPHLSDAPLEELVDLILQVRAGAYSIEAANPRHEHEWRVWSNGRLPAGKILIPGVVTHHTIVVEHPRIVADRIIRFANLVGRENVIAGTDCGFAQTEIIQRVHPTVMWAKLEALVAGARLATEELWN
jgi:5-methyltetrahydropteroyltriglutamate--homocysteine methyltransferase